MAFKVPGKGQDQDCGNHCLETVRQTVAAFPKAHDPAQAVVKNREQQGKNTAEGKSNGSIAACECGNEIDAGEEAAGIQHTEDTADDQHENR